MCSRKYFNTLRLGRWLRLFVPTSAQSANASAEFYSLVAIVFIRDINVHINCGHLIKRLAAGYSIWRVDAVFVRWHSGIPSGVSFRYICIYKYIYICANWCVEFGAGFLLMGNIK